MKFEVSEIKHGHFKKWKWAIIEMKTATVSPEYPGIEGSLGVDVPFPSCTITELEKFPEIEQRTIT